MKYKHPFSYYLGNTLIFVSLLGFVFIFYPIIRVYLFPPKISEVVTAAAQSRQETYITIPKIVAQAPVIEQVDPWNQAVYLEALKKGVAHARGTSLPGEKGTVFIFAHSSGTPWEMTYMNTIFLRLGELQQGDHIQIDRKGEKYVYKVREKKEVSPAEVNYLLQNEKDQLILQTCTPIGTSLRRLLVFADPAKLK